VIASHSPAVGAAVISRPHHAVLAAHNC